MTALTEFALTTGMFLVGGVTRAALLLGVLFALSVPLMLLAGAAKLASDLRHHHLFGGTAALHR